MQLIQQRDELERASLRNLKEEVKNVPVKANNFINHH